MSSNEEHKADMRPGAGGWTPDVGDKKNTAILFVADALIYGASIHLQTAKCVEKYDIILEGIEGNAQRLKVCITDC